MKAENHGAAKLAVGLILLSAFGIGSLTGIGTWWSKGMLSLSVVLLVLSALGFVMIGIEAED